ncbi:MAG: T9SS type A sorting domain-containing protein, partial [Candidatus Cloacimonetes bacterium]|nr:T9SS type A sorting domain-containing protein [Candidatus Cloacimonadota bacterium]
ENEIPENTNFDLYSYPNPFNPTTSIMFSIQNDSKVELAIYNLKGQRIKILAQNEFAKGLHSIIWNGDDENNNPISSGIYLYKLNINGKTESVNKCLLLK